MAKIKRKTRNILVVIWCILFNVTIFSLVWTKFLYGGIHTELKDGLVADEFFSKWQSYISDDAVLNEIVIPGSHDAGTLNMMPLAETQGHSIADQLRGGVRYFDLRAAKKGDDIVIYHGVIKGQSLSTVLLEFKDFISANPSEFIILDFQHIQSEKIHDKVIKMTVETLGVDKMMKKSVCVSIESTTMADVRHNGFNYALIWTKTADTENVDYLYARTRFLSSPYKKDVHKSKNTDDLIGQFDKYIDGNTGSGFFVLQAQRTSYNFLFLRPADLELEIKDKINAYVNGLSEEKLSKVNIIMRDFIVSDMDNVKTILRLNVAKGLIPTEKAEEYSFKVA